MSSSPSETLEHNADPQQMQMQKLGESMFELASQVLAAGNAQAADLLKRISRQLAQIEEKLNGQASGQPGAAPRTAERPAGDGAVSVQANHFDSAALAPLREELAEVRKILAALPRPAGAADFPELRPERIDKRTADLLAILTRQGEERQAAVIRSLASAINQSGDGLKSWLEDRLRHSLREQSQALVEELRPEEPQEAGMALEHLEGAVFGGELARLEKLQADRRQLLEQMLAGDNAAQAVVGSLLLFHSTPEKERHKLLKPLGEAYYRWRPKCDDSEDAMEEELIFWLNKKCHEASIPLYIEVVHPGVRYDSDRHVAEGKMGRDVTEVLGWVVMRDNNKVFDRARVAVK